MPVVKSHVYVQPPVGVVWANTVVPMARTATIMSAFFIVFSSS